MSFCAKIINRFQNQHSGFNQVGCDQVCTPFLDAINTLIMSVRVYLKSKLWHTAKNIATFLITKELSCERRQDVGQWSHSLIWRIRSLVQAQGHTLATAVGLSPGHRHPTGWDSVSPDIDVMWKKKKLSLLSDATKLNTSLPLFLCLFLCLIYRASRSSSRGECGTSFYYLILVLFFLFSLFTVLTLLLLAGPHWSLRNLRLHRPVCARVGLQGLCSTECGNPWKEAFIQVL